MSSVQEKEEENFIETQKRDGGTDKSGGAHGRLRPPERTKGAAQERDLREKRGGLASGALSSLRVLPAGTTTPSMQCGGSEGGGQGGEGRAALGSLGGAVWSPALDVPKCFRGIGTGVRCVTTPEPFLISVF